MYWWQSGLGNLDLVMCGVMCGELSGCCDSFQDDCSRVGIELKQTLTVVFPPSINSQGYIGR